MKKNFRKLAALSIITMLSIFSLNTQYTIQAFASNNISTISYDNISTKADIIEWRFKSENGVIYKRLFNYSTAQWVGDWILIP